MPDVTTRTRPVHLLRLFPRPTVYSIGRGARQALPLRNEPDIRYSKSFVRLGGELTKLSRHSLYWLLVKFTHASLLLVIRRGYRKHEIAL
jgi:hypothetical protein